jgi:hypothetical protein
MFTRGIQFLNGKFSHIVILPAPMHVDQQISIIPVARRKMVFSSETTMAQEAINTRIRAHGRNYSQMEEKLERYCTAVNLRPTAPVFREIAEFLISQDQRQGLDRHAKRNKQALICWFCEHCTELLVSDDLFSRFYRAIVSANTAARPRLPSIDALLTEANCFHVCDFPLRVCE